LELILSRANNVRGCSNTAEGGVVNEGRSSERSGRDCHFFDNATNNVRDVRKRSTIDGVDIRGLAGENSSDLSDDAIYVFACKVLDRC
jgi:hypothetical protein